MAVLTLSHAGTVSHPAWGPGESPAPSLSSTSDSLIEWNKTKVCFGFYSWVFASQCTASLPQAGHVSDKFPVSHVEAHVSIFKHLWLFSVIWPSACVSFWCVRHPDLIAPSVFLDLTYCLADLVLPCETSVLSRLWWLQCFLDRVWHVCSF